MNSFRSALLRPARSVCVSPSAFFIFHLRTAAVSGRHHEGPPSREIDLEANGWVKLLFLITNPNPDHNLYSDFGDGGPSVAVMSIVIPVSCFCSWNMFELSSVSLDPSVDHTMDRPPLTAVVRCSKYSF